MFQGAQIHIFPLGNFSQLFFLIFKLWKVKKVLFLFDSISDVHDDRRSLHQRLCSPQLSLLFLRKLRRRRNTTCCCLTQAVTGYLFHRFFFSERRWQSGKIGRINCGINFYLLPASVQTARFHWSWQLIILPPSLLSAFQKYSKKCWLLSTRHDGL